jgi:crossover junction endodeoxyribonuclease RuvC
MRVMGVDPGLNATGIGIIEITGDATTHVHHAVIRTSTADELPARIQIIHQAVHAAALEWAVTDGAIESSFVGSNARSAMLLGHARAAAMLGLVTAGVPVAEYAPRLVKQSVTGYGAGDKSQVARMVAFQLGLTELPTPADASDALAVAITHWAQSRLSARL